MSAAVAGITDSGVDGAGPTAIWRCILGGRHNGERMQISGQFFRWWMIGSLTFLGFLGVDTWQDVRLAIRSQEAMAAVIAATGDTVPLPCRGLADVDYTTHEAHPGGCFFTEEAVRRLYPELARASFEMLQDRMRPTLIDVGETPDPARREAEAEKLREALAANPTVLIVRAALIGVGVSLLPLVIAFAVRRSRENLKAQPVPETPSEAMWTRGPAAQTRGQFMRLWGIATAIFIGLLTAYAVEEMPKINAAQEELVSAFVAYNGEMLLPCTQARGVLDVDYRTDSSEAFCLYSEEKFLEHWPDFRDEDIDSLRLRFYAAAMGVDPAYAGRNAAEEIRGAVILGIGVPLLSLLVGLAGRWGLTRMRAQRAGQASP